MNHKFKQWWYALHSGKPIKILFFIQKALGTVMPLPWYQYKKKNLLDCAKNRSDYGYIKERVDYYCKIKQPWQISDHERCERGMSVLHFSGRLKDYHRKMFNTAYFYDQRDVTRWFPQNLRWNFCPGDVYFTPEEPTVVKSRLLVEDNQNSVLLKLDKLRHFFFVKDHLDFRSKKDMAVFRGKIRQSRLRRQFLERYFGHPMFNCGVVGKNEGFPDEWLTDKMTIREHLEYKFIIALEGNDVASNLKWVMSSNSIAVMTRPTCETWFMEGKLKPFYHYIEIKEDFSDVEEKLQYYIDHPEEAESIIKHAHEYLEQFKDKEREELIQVLVLEKYFETSKQL